MDTMGYSKMWKETWWCILLGPNCTCKFCYNNMCSKEQGAGTAYDRYCTGTNVLGLHEKQKIVLQYSSATELHSCIFHLHALPEYLHWVQEIKSLSTNHSTCACKSTRTFWKKLPVKELRKMTYGLRYMYDVCNICIFGHFGLSEESR